MPGRLNRCAAGPTCAVLLPTTPFLRPVVIVPITRVFLYSLLLIAIDLYVFHNNLRFPTDYGVPLFVCAAFVDIFFIPSIYL